MRRTGHFRILLSLVFLALAVIGLLARAVRHQPMTYAPASVPAEAERRRLSGEFASNVQRLADTVASRADDRWAEAFSADQINCYFAEDFVRARPFALPESVHSPRVLIQPGKLQLAFRCGHGFWSSVVTIDLKAWLVAHEPNVIAVQLLNVHAGVVPVATQSILERIAEAARKINLEVTWYRHEGRPTALVRFQTDRASPSVVLRRFELMQDQIVIEGQTLEPAPVKAMLSMNQQ